MSRKNKVIVILGPTASGKSQLALKLAQKFNGFIISADSRQIYQKMNIATAKPSQADRQLIPHFMIDIVKPGKNFSVAEYQQQVFKILHANLRSKQPKLPFIVGGTGLYIQAMVDNLNIPRAAPDENLRQKLAKKSAAWLLAKLEKVDPISCQKISANNKRRLIRALEVYEKTGQPFSAWQNKGESEFEFLQIGLKLDRQKLYQRINERMEKMITTGLVEEVKNLRKKYDQKLPSMSGLGYKEIGLYLDSKINLPEAINLLKRNTRHYARKQISWFSRDKKIKWVESYKQAEKIVKDFVCQ